MRDWSFAILALLALISCGARKDSSVIDKKEITTKESNKLDYKEVPEEILTLSTKADSENTIANIEENLFGKFFCDRAAFYVVKNPENIIYSSSPESITLYYLDGELQQTKYIFREDITQHLIHALGAFKISGLDSKNKEIIGAQQIIIRTEKGRILNHRLDNYVLKWTFGGKEVRYRVSPNSIDKFVYLERETNYEKKFKVIEKYCL